VPDTWVAGAVVAQLLHVHPRKVTELATAGHLRTQHIPGMGVRYSLADAIRLAEAAERPLATPLELPAAASSTPYEVTI
jgi:hypothetical protein